jgi:hypothetical protein
MTDLAPNDLSHLSDEEFNALAPQGYHATGPAEPLSPVAQSVLDAYRSTHLSINNLAAALRAAADQCKIEWNYHPDYPETESVIIVSDLLDIAAELDGIKPTSEENQ